MSNAKITVFGCIAIAALYPLIIEEKGSYCAAVESRFIKIASNHQFFGNASDSQAATDLGAVFVFGLMGESNGAIAEGIVRQKYQNAPPTVACAYVYWQSMVDPEGMVKATRDYLNE